MKKLSVFLVLIAGLLYLGAIVWAGIESLKSPEPPDLPPPVILAITVIGGVLATHFGAIFGISQSNGLGSAKFVMSLKRLVMDKTVPMLNRIQILAAWLYPISLLAAIVFWGFDDAFSDKTAEVIKALSSTFIGVLGGVLAVALNVRQDNT